MKKSKGAPAKSAAKHDKGDGRGATQPTPRPTFSSSHKPNSNSRYSGTVAKGEATGFNPQLDAIVKKHTSTKSRGNRG